MFRCECCGEEFYEPDSRKFHENLDGENGWWTYTEEYCPRCGSQDFREAVDEEQEDECA